MTENINLKIQMGDLCRDTVTGFEGIVTSEHRFAGDPLTQYGITPQKLNETGKAIRPMTFTMNRLKVIQQDVVPALKTGTAGG